MRKTFIVAQSEFATLVRSKAFIISVVLMPAVMALSIFLVRSTKDTMDYKDRTFAFVDYSGVIADPLKAVAEMYNSSADTTNAPAVNLSKGPLVRTGARFIAVEIILPCASRS